MSFRLQVLLDKQAPSDAEVYVAPFDWRYDDTGVVGPDVLVCWARDVHFDDRLRAPAVPLLLVEVLSPSNPGYDKLLKRELYESLGVPGYWIVHPGSANKEPSVVALALSHAGIYEVEGEATGSQMLTLERPFAASFRPNDLLIRRNDR